MLRPEEKLVFQAFDKTYPDFAGRPVTCMPGSDPPDILCIDGEGRRIGIELGEWLNEEQIGASKQQEKLERSYLEAIRSEKVAPPTNIGLIWLNTKPKVMLKQSDAQVFRDEILRLVEAIDNTWEAYDDHDSPQGFSIDDFSKYPCLKHYIETLRVFSRSGFKPVMGVPWIRFPAPGGAYTPQTAVDALLGIIDKKTTKYLNLHQQYKLDELYLIIYYNKGLFYNTPFEVPGFGFREIANGVSLVVKKRHGAFQKILLFNAIIPDQEAIQIWP